MRTSVLYATSLAMIWCAVRFGVTYAEREGITAEASPALLHVEMEPPEFRLPEHVRHLADIPYCPSSSTSASPSQMLDLYLPRSEIVSLTKRPVVVWIHGGGWRSGSRLAPPLLSLVSQGFVLASLDYRTSDEALFPAQIQDCRTAVRWLRAHAAEHGLDASRIGVVGGESGGHLAALLGVLGTHCPFDDLPFWSEQSSDVQAVATLGAPIDFLTLDEQTGSNHLFRHSDVLSPESLLLGGPLKEQTQLANHASPLTHLASASNLPPFLIFHAMHDQVVPYQQAEQLALWQRHGRVRLLPLPGEETRTQYPLFRRVHRHLERFFLQSLGGNAGSGIAIPDTLH